MNILFSCVGRRRYLVEYFKKELFGSGFVFGTDASRTAPALSSCDKWFEVPSIYDETYLDVLLNICVENEVDAVISLNDMELPILAAKKASFLAHGIRLIVSDTEAIRICSDKWATVEFARSIGVPVPASYISLEAALSSVESGQQSFPMIVKPRWGSASFGLHVVDNQEELISAFNECKNSVKSSYLSSFAEGDDVVLIQSFIRGNEYGLDIFNDLKACFRGVVCKKKISMRAGETDKAITVSDEKFVKYATNIAESLRHIGNLDCDFLEDETGIYLLELNPRFGGGYPFSHESGGNLVKALLLSLDDKDDLIDIKYNVDEIYAKCDIIVKAREA